MEEFDLQLMRGDGSFADFKVRTERNTKTYEILQDDEPVAQFSATADGGWALENNPGKIDEDLQQRITLQLNGFRESLL